MSNEPEEQEDVSHIEKGQASDESLVRSHARLRRQKDNTSPVAFFTALALITVLTFSWFYVRRYMGQEEKAQQYLHKREDIALYVAHQNRPREVKPIIPFEEGRELFAGKGACIGCHQANGEGMTGVNPPLVGSEWVIHEDASLPIKILISGMSGPVEVKGATYNGNMPAVGTFSDEEISYLVTYIRGEWGNGASAVTPEDVAAVRAEIGDRGPWKAEELQSYFQ